MELKTDGGKEVEDLVEKICTKMFFSDFTVRSPKFKKENLQEKEAADILIPFDNELIAFQVKTKTELKSASEKNDIDFKRINKIIEKAVDQLKTIKRALAKNRITDLKTAKGYTVPFTCDSVRKVIGVIIIDLLGEEKFPESDRTFIMNGFVVRNDIPTHIFKREEFEAISSELDTLPDFLEYLSIRELLFSNNLFLLPPLELDLLAFYKVDPDKVIGAIKRQINLIIEEGSWEHYQTQYADDIRKRNRLNEPSYLIDMIIEWLHSSVGFDLNTEVIQRVSRKQQGTIEGYLAIAVELAKISRIQRRLIGERLFKCLIQADNIGHGHSLIIDTNAKRGILVVCSSGTREQRGKELYNLSAMAYCANDLNKLIGIATEPLSVHLRSYDVFMLNGESFENHEELRELAKKVFGSRHEADFSEYQETK